MTAFADLVKEVAIDVANCPQPLIVRALRNATIQLCERAKVLQQDLDAIDIEADKNLYPLTIPENLAIVDLRQVLCDGQPLDATSPDALTRNYTAWRRGLPAFQWWDSVVCDCGTDAANAWQTATADKPAAYFQPDTTSIRVVATPTQPIAGGLEIHAALKPTRAATDAPDWLVEDHFEALCDGARAELMAVPAKSWSQPQLALYYRSLFDAAVSRARADALRGGTRDDEAVGRTTAYV